MATKTVAKRKSKTPAPRYFKGYGAEVARFAQENLVQTKGRWAGKPLILEPWQRELLDELYLVDSEGKRIYKEALVGIARKNGKSTLVSAIGLHGLVAAGEGGPEVYAAAASVDQARIVFSQAREYVEASAYLRQYLNPLRSVIRCGSNDGIFRVLSADGPLAHGLNPSLVSIDELHAHKDPELYWALTTGVIARLEPLVVSITTAGYDRSSICWDVYQRGKELEAEGGLDAMRKAGFLFIWHAAPPEALASDRKAWMAANPSSWVTEEVLEREYDRLPESVFRRLHLNQWTESEDSWISPEDWDACVGRPQLRKDAETWFGIDIGLKRDASAIVWVQWHGGRLHIAHDIQIPTDKHSLSAMENRAKVAKLTTKFQALREVNFDPWSFQESAEELAERGLPMVRFDQNASRMAPASEHLYELVRERRVVHNGDPMLRRQVLAAVASETERGWRISKRKSNERIDACVALAMAADRAVVALNEPRLTPDDYRITQL